MFNYLNTNMFTRNCSYTSLWTLTRCDVSHRQTISQPSQHTSIARQIHVQNPVKFSEGKPITHEAPSRDDALNASALGGGGVGWASHWALNGRMAVSWRRSDVKARRRVPFWPAVVRPPPIRAPCRAVLGTCSGRSRAVVEPSGDAASGARHGENGAAAPTGQAFSH